MSDKVEAWRYVKGVDDLTLMSQVEVFNRGFDYGFEDAQIKMKAMAATADLSGVKTILAAFEERLKDFAGALTKIKPRDILKNARHLTIPDLESMTDRQISNVIHGRHKDDNGEFTASSMGAANDALQREHSASPIPRDIFTDVADVYAKREAEGRNPATGVIETEEHKRKREADIMQMTADKGERANNAEPSAHRVNAENARILVKRLGLKPSEVFPECKFIPMHTYTPVGAQATFSDGSVWTRTE